MLDEAKGGWVNELPSVLWAYRTTTRRSTGKTPFSLTYGMEAIIPLEIRLPTIRTEAYSHEQNRMRIAEHLDLIEEQRDQALIRLAAYQQQLARSYQKKVRERVFKVGDLVLRKVFLNTKDPNHGKLGPTWEGPYRVTSQERLEPIIWKHSKERPRKDHGM
ncbi:hypothetical protein AAC387_Pa01g3805 [Persea americana]